MRTWLWTHALNAKFASNPMLLGVAVALSDLYEPTIGAALPGPWAGFVATVEAGIPAR